MPEVYCYSWVEDAPSASVLRKLVAVRNSRHDVQLRFRDGFPAIMHGNGRLKAKCPSFVQLALHDSYSLVLTDLDDEACVVTMIRKWFGMHEDVPLALPRQCLFRVAIREVEAWLLADRAAWAEYTHIPAANFSSKPDELDDPKSHILNIVRRKGSRKLQQIMLPESHARIGPGYNDFLCDFVDNLWVPDRAARNSPSLSRTIQALDNV